MHQRLRRAGVSAAIGVSGVLLVQPGLHGGAGQDRQAPSFNQEVAPILFSRCAGCHRPGDVAPMSLLSYASARPWARSIKARVQAREMPPWPADPAVGRFRNEQVLSDVERATLVAWVDAGAPEGTGSPPPAPPFLEGWSSQMNRPPDVIIEAPLRLDLPAQGLIPEFSVWSSQPFGKDRVIEAIELRPTNRSAVHHASVFRSRLPRGARIGRAAIWPGGPVFDGIPLSSKGVPLSLATPMASLGQPLVFYVPSGGFLRFPKGVGKRIASDEFLMWTFHLTTSGRAAQAGARVGLWFSRDTVRNDVTTWTVTDRVQVNGKDVRRDAGGPIFPNIAPNDPEYTVTGFMTLARPATLYALWPHMHYRGRDITFSLVDGKGRDQPLLHIPQYRFGWQFTYELATPLRLAAGATIKAVAHYDNSSRNRENPDPGQEVVWGPQADNEMFDPFVELAYERPAPSLLGDCGTGSDAGPGAPGLGGGGLFPPRCP